MSERGPRPNTKTVSTSTSGTRSEKRIRKDADISKVLNSDTSLNADVSKSPELDQYHKENVEKGIPTEMISSLPTIAEADETTKNNLRAVVEEARKAGPLSPSERRDLDYRLDTRDDFYYISKTVDAIREKSGDNAAPIVINGEINTSSFEEEGNIRERMIKNEAARRDRLGIKPDPNSETEIRRQLEKRSDFDSISININHDSIDIDIPKERGPERTAARKAYRSAELKLMKAEADRIDSQLNK